MKIGRDQIIQLLLSQGHDDQAVQAGSQLPGQVDTSNPNHAQMLSECGVSPADLDGVPGGPSEGE